MNAVGGKIKLGKETLADIDGFWDGEITLTDRNTGVLLEKLTIAWRN